MNQLGLALAVQLTQIRVTHFIGRGLQQDNKTNEDLPRGVFPPTNIPMGCSITFAGIVALVLGIFGRIGLCVTSVTSVTMVFDLGV